MQNQCSWRNINFLLIRILTFRYCLFHPSRNTVPFCMTRVGEKCEFKATRVRNGECWEAITHLSPLPEKIQTKNTMTA